MSRKKITPEAVAAAAIESAPTPTPTPKSARKPRRKKSRFDWRAWAWQGCLLAGLLFGVTCVAFGSWKLWQSHTEKASPLPSHAAIVNYAQLLATDVCSEIEAAIDAAEESGEPFTGEQAAKIMHDRGEEARKAAWFSVFEGYNALQDDDGSIPYAKAREAVAKTRQGLEAVR